MEFVALAEIWTELKHRGIVDPTPRDPADAGGRGGLLAIDPARDPVTVELAAEGSPGTSKKPGRSGRVPAIVAPPDRIAATLETVLHKLHLAPLYLIPATTWRTIFDVVAFGLASNKDWQEIDSQASVQQNTRDPLLCELRNLHLLRELVRVLLVDGAETDAPASHALSIVATGQSLVAQVVPGHPIRIMVGSAVVAEQVTEAANHFLGRP